MQLLCSTIFVAFVLSCCYQEARQLRGFAPSSPTSSFHLSWECQTLPQNSPGLPHPFGCKMTWVSHQPKWLDWLGMVTWLVSMILLWYPSNSARMPLYNTHYHWLAPIVQCICATPYSYAKIRCFSTTNSIPMAHTKSFGGWSGSGTGPERPVLPIQVRQYHLLMSSLEAKKDLVEAIAALLYDLSIWHSWCMPVFGSQVCKGDIGFNMFCHTASPWSQSQATSTFSRWPCSRLSSAAIQASNHRS